MLAGPGDLTSYSQTTSVKQIEDSANKLFYDCKENSPDRDEHTLAASP